MNSSDTAEERNDTASRGRTTEIAIPGDLELLALGVHELVEQRLDVARRDVHRGLARGRLGIQAESRNDETGGGSDAGRALNGGSAGARWR